jgi:SAM-dependent methyltransferase
MTVDQETLESMTSEALDEARVEAFAEHLFGLYGGGMVTLIIDLAHRTGLLEAAAQGPATSAELADRAGLTERYARECLGCLVTAGIIDYDPAARTYRLPAEHAVVLTGPGSLNLAPVSQITTLLAHHVDGVAKVAREGGGVPYEAFRPAFTEVMDGLSRGLLDGQLIEGILPLTGALTDRLAAGVRVADVGCGTGHSTNLLARAHPRSRFVGYDIAADAIERARAEADAYGLDNVTFEVLDVARLPAQPAVDAVFAFDAIHDQVDPAGVLARIFDALAPAGVFVMVDIKAHSNLEDNLHNPFAPMLYAVSTLHCMTVSLAHDGAGLGTVWGEELARTMLADAGFVDVTVHDVPDDPLDVVYVARKAGGLTPRPREMRRSTMTASDGSVDPPPRTSLDLDVGLGGVGVRPRRREDGVVELHPLAAVPADQAWFWTERWQEMERDADADVAAGRVTNDDTVEELFRAFEA